MKTQIWMALGFLFGVSAIAQDRLTEIKASRPGASPYEVLREHYDDARVPARLEDFDLNLDVNSTQRCTFVSQETPTHFTNAFILRMRGIKPGEPSHGPLFPGTPDQTIDVLAITTSSSRSALDSRVSAIVAGTKMSLSPTDLLLEVDDRALYNDAPLEMALRRNGNLLAFRAKNQVGSSSQGLFYGYCYYP